MREFAFEQRLCRALEADLTPIAVDGVLARQIGASAGRGGTRRVIDVLSVEPGPEFERRVQLSAQTIPPAALEGDASVGEWREVSSVFDSSPEHAGTVADRALDCGFFEQRWDGTDRLLRAVTRYPDWYSRLIGFENKPDLGTPGELQRQLRKDVSLGVLDCVILTTESYVTRAHLNRIPDAVGVWRVEWPESRARPPDGRSAIGVEPEITVVREPRSLETERAGVQLMEFQPLETEIQIVSPEAKARQRRRMAERAYGKGWRVDGLPDCANVDCGADSETTLPYCTFKQRVVNPSSDCGTACDGFDSEPAPSYDPDAERERQSAWTAEPDGFAREQAGLDQFHRSR